MVADAQRLVEIVGDEHDGAVEAVLDLHQLILHVVADQRIERAERLVHQQHLGIGRERPGEADPLLHAAGELARILVLETLQADHIDLGLGPVADVGTAAACQAQPPGKPPDRPACRRPVAPALVADLQTAHDILEHRFVGQQSEALEHHAHLEAPQVAQRLRVELQHILAVHQDASVGRLDQPVDVPDQGRLARAGQAHDDEDLAFPDVEADIADADGVAGLLEQFLLAGSGP